MLVMNVKLMKIKKQSGEAPSDDTPKGNQLKYKHPIALYQFATRKDNQSLLDVAILIFKICLNNNSRPHTAV